MSPRLDVDAVGPVSSRGAALPAPRRSEATRLPPVQEFGDGHFFGRQDLKKTTPKKTVAPTMGICTSRHIEIEGKWK